MLTKYISLPLALLVMAFAITACNNDLEQAEENKGKVDVTLLINTRATDNEEAIKQGEGIRTLRLIVTHLRTGAVEVNSMIPVKDGDTSSLTFTLNGCEIGKHNFWLIANEASLSLEAQKSLQDGQVNPSIVTDASVFPCLGVPETGLPMSAMKQVEVKKDMEQPNFNLTYLVSKIELKINNSTGKNFNLGKVSYRQVAKKTSLFNATPLDIQADQIYEEEMADEVPIKNNEYTTQTYYFYPTSLNQVSEWKKPLEIALNKDMPGDSYDYTVVKPVGDADMSSIKPNQLVKINGTISSSGYLSLICSVKPWVETGNDNESEWDYTNLVSFYSDGWDKGTVVSDDAVVTITNNNFLTFRIQSPKKATWSAELDYSVANGGIGGSGVNKFSITPSEGVVDGSPVTMEVTCPVDAERVQATLKVTVRNAMNVSWPVLLYPSSTDIIEGTVGERKHYVLSFSH